MYQDGIGTGWKNVKIEKKNDNAKVDKVGGRTGTAEIFI